MTETKALPQSVKLVAGHAPNGKAVIEEVAAEALPNKEFRLLASPAFAKDIAKGDKLAVVEGGVFRIKEHGGNLCIRVIASEGLDAVAESLAADLEKLGGSLDLSSDRILVYSIHVSCGFEAIEKLFNDALKNNAGATWFYGNVYDSADGTTPLNWWIDILKPE